MCNPFFLLIKFKVIFPVVISSISVVAEVLPSNLFKVPLPSVVGDAEVLLSNLVKVPLPLLGFEVVPKTKIQSKLRII